MKIRIAKLSDVAGCQKINESLWGSEWIDPGYYEERVQKDELFVAIDDNNCVIGFVSFRRKYWDKNFFIEELALDEKHRRKGIGKSLVLMIEKACATEDVRLFSSCDSTNSVSLAVHKKLGFIKAGEIKNMFKEGKKEIIFSKIRHVLIFESK